MSDHSTPQTSGPKASVPKDPQPTIDRVDDLARRILSADILLPKFQRDFVWNKEQIRKLLDSVSRGYPIGSILLWQSRQELRSTESIADLPITAPRPDYPVNYLLDGQQRLSTICGALYWKGADSNSPWNIAYDLRSEQFVHLDSLDDPPLHQIRVNKLSDPSSFFKHLSSLDNLNAPDKQGLKERGDHLFNRFKDYKIASVTLGDMSIDDVAPIFERINSEGTPLTIVDLTRAATWSPQFDLIDSIDGILLELKDKDYSRIDRKVILRNISAATGGGFSVESIEQLRKSSPADLTSATENTKLAYKRAVDYLYTQVGIPNATILPYSNQFTVVAEIFRQLPTPSATQYQEISKWFWRSTYSGYFSGWNTGMMTSDLDAITKFASNGNSTINIDFHPPGIDVWLERTFRLNTAHAKLLAILLGHKRPIDLLTGQKVDVSRALAWENSKEFHHFFPKAYLDSIGVKSAHTNSLANFIMLSSASNKAISALAPSQYLKKVEQAAGADLQIWLESNLISHAAYLAAKQDDFSTFRSERAKTLDQEAKQLSGW